MRKKAAWRKDGMKMLIHTGHKEFDRQTNDIGTGNIIANTQFGWFIRPRIETMCNGYEFPEGHLRNTDLGYFSNLPRFVRKAVLDLTETDCVILYEFFHYGRDGEPRVHGYIVTDEDGRFVTRFVTGPTYKSCMVLNGVLPYICENWEEVSDA